LSSRKRKLRELYYASEGFFLGSATGASPDLYQHKEAAFLRANDITQ
jgi:hypothetical protein